MEKIVMKNNKLSFLGCLGLACFLTSLSVYAAPRSYHGDAVSYLKNYAISVCIAKGYSATEVKNDAAAAARGYSEFGEYSLEAHSAVRNLAQQFLARHYGSMSGEPMTLAKCIDLYHSRELDSIIEKYKDKK
nr:T6SS amidase immunity protein Tai4 family protein [Serratia rubidaea]